MYTGIKSLGYIWKGLQTLAQRKLEVPVLDATAIGVSILRGNYDTAGSVIVPSWNWRTVRGLDT